MNLEQAKKEAKRLFGWTGNAAIRVYGYRDDDLEYIVSKRDYGILVTGKSIESFEKAFEAMKGKP